MGGRDRPTTLIDVGDHDDQNGGDDNFLWDDEPVNVLPGCKSCFVLPNLFLPLKYFT